MKKKIWITIGILTLLSLWAIMYVPYNLEEYNYYYATHMKHRRYQYTFIPALGMAKLPPKYLPDFQIDYFKKKDIQNNTLIKRNVLRKGDYLTIDSQYLSYAPTKKAFDKNDITVFSGFENDGLLSFDRKQTGKRLIKVLDDTQAELKHNSKKPLINLQVLYNREFNSMNGKR